MMEKIKFRVWDKVNKIMEYNVNIINGKPVKRGYQWFNTENIVLYSKPQQYTCLKDRNGKEIYDGDIVKYVLYEYENEIIGIVRIGQYKQDGSGGKYAPTKNLGVFIERIKTFPTDWEIEYEWEPNELDYQRTISLLQPYWIEVIGNIYENPEFKTEEI